MNTNEAWNKEITRIMALNVDDMEYTDLTMLALEYRDTEELAKWAAEGSDAYFERQKEYEKKYGISYPIKENAPDKVKKAYSKLCNMRLEAAREGTIIL